MSRKNNKVELPQVEDRPRLGFLYMAINTLDGNGQITTKDQAAAHYKSIHAKDPEVIFYGPPNGSLIYMGPVGDNVPAINIKNLLRVQ